MSNTTLRKDLAGQGFDWRSGKVFAVIFALADFDTYGKDAEELEADRLTIEHEGRIYIYADYYGQRDHLLHLKKGITIELPREHPLLDIEYDDRLDGRDEQPLFRAEDAEAIYFPVASGWSARVRKVYKHPAFLEQYPEHWRIEFE